MLTPARPHGAGTARSHNTAGLDLAPPNLHVTMGKVAVVLRRTLIVAITKSPMAKGYQELGQLCYGCEMCQHHV